MTEETNDPHYDLLCGHCGRRVWQHSLAQVRLCAIAGSDARRAEDRKRTVEWYLASGHAVTKEQVEALLAEAWQKEDEAEARQRAETEKLLDDLRRKAREGQKHA